MLAARWRNPVNSVYGIFFQPRPKLTPILFPHLVLVFRVGGLHVLEDGVLDELGQLLRGFADAFWEIPVTCRVL